VLFGETPYRIFLNIVDIDTTLRYMIFEVSSDSSVGRQCKIMVKTMLFFADDVFME